jgi:hypothetical protein
MEGQESSDEWSARDAMNSNMGECRVAVPGDRRRSALNEARVALMAARLDGLREE